MTLHEDITLKDLVGLYEVTGRAEFVEPVVRGSRGSREADRIVVMAVTPMILNVHISAPASNETGENLWRVDLDGGLSRDGTFRSGGLLAICDTEREAQAFVAALGLDSLLTRMSEYLSRP